MCNSTPIQHSEKAILHVGVICYQDQMRNEKVVLVFNIIFSPWNGVTFLNLPNNRTDCSKQVLVLEIN